LNCAFRAREKFVMKRFLVSVALSLAVVSVAAARAQETAAGEKRHVSVDSLHVVAGASGATVPVTQDAKVIGSEVELALRDLYGAEQRLSALRGRVVVLNFWATYCVPCRKEMPDLAAIQNNYAALGVQVVGASADDAAARPKVLQFIKETKLNFPVWLGATTGDMERFGLAPALPGTVIIGRDGRIAWHKSGVVTEAEVKKQVEEQLTARATTGEEKTAQPESAAARPARTDASTVPS
jgi:thiol-disulfide isomerase/thioredoxin